MKIRNENISILTILIICFLSNISYAHAQDTVEASVTDTYNKSLELLRYLYSDERPMEDNKLVVELIDYGVELVKKAPRSFETYTFVIRFDNSRFKGSFEYLEKIDKLKETYLKEIDNFENNLPEKFILMLSILNSYIMNNTYRRSWPEKELNSQHYDLAINALKKLSEYKDKDYAILAQICLIPGLGDTKAQDEIIAKFPGHPLIPLVKLSKTGSLFFNGNYDELIEFVIKLSKEYKGIKTPEGYGFELECYETACSACLAQKDFDNAEKYLKLIEEAAPDSRIAKAARKRYERTKNPSPNAYKIDESSIKNFIEAQEKAKEEAKKKGIDLDSDVLDE